MTLTRRRLLTIALLGLGAPLAACGGSAGSEPTAALGATEVVHAPTTSQRTIAETQRIFGFWAKGGGEDLLRGKSFQALFDSLPNRLNAFEQKDIYLRCSDEGTPGGIRMAGSGILNARAAVDLAGKLGGIWTHDRCDAAKLYCAQQGIKTDDPDAIADARARMLADKLGVPFMGRIPASAMIRPADLHNARVIYYDGTGRFDPSVLSGLPLGFVISRKHIVDTAYGRSEVQLALESALGEQGFGKLFTDLAPLYVVAVTGLDKESIAFRYLAEELSQVARGLENVEVQSIVVNPTVLAKDDTPKEIVKTAARVSGTPKAAPKATPRPAIKAIDPNARFGPTYIVKDGLINVPSDIGRRYLKFSIAVELAPPEGTPEAETKESAKLFEQRMTRYAPAIKETTANYFALQRYERLITSDGKETARRELTAQLRRLLEGSEDVTNVYFVEYIFQ